MNTETVVPPPAPGNHSKLIGKLVLLVAASTIFGIALVPLYDTICRVTGLNGKTFVNGGLASVDAKPVARVDRSRLVTVEFTGTVMPGLAWEMRPLKTRVDLHPGEMQQVAFLVRNTADHAVVGRAVPSVTPGQAAQHFEKIECFCFNLQTLGPGEAREMPLMFIVKPELDGDVRTITLSYAFFAAPEAEVAPTSATSRKDGRT
jgi:cytochrome c oxidase assembly protein subunit 11